MKPELISFNLCPFVQRASIVLEHKKIPHNVRYVDLSSPPDWFLQISPLKKVPVLKIDETVIFDSTVINEYLDEAYPESLHPDDVIERATNRSWIEYGGECLMNAHRVAISQSNADFLNEREDLWLKFDHLESATKAAPYFNGEHLSLVDCAYAPMFQRLDYLVDIGIEVYDVDRHQNIERWRTHLVDLNAVKKSTVPDLQTIYYDFIGKYEGYAKQFL